AILALTEGRRDWRALTLGPNICAGVMSDNRYYVNVASCDEQLDQTRFRTGQQLIGSVRAYLEWRAGVAWRQRFDPCRLCYLRALATLDEAWDKPSPDEKYNYARLGWLVEQAKAEAAAGIPQTNNQVSRMRKPPRSVWAAGVSRKRG